MSDPSDPYRTVDVGGGINPFGESIESLSKVEDTLGNIASKFEGLGKSLEKVSSKIEKGFKPVTKEMNKSKFVKATKGLKGMFKSMVGAAASGGKIGLLMATLKPLMAILKPLADLFKPFELIFTLISTLISVMVASALGPMYEALQPLYKAIISLMPTFVELGTLLGTFIAAIITNLIGIFILLIPPIVAFITELMNSEGFMILVGVALGALAVLFGLLVWPIGILMGVIIVLTTIFDAIATVIDDVVMPAIQPLLTVFAVIGTIIDTVVIPAIRTFIMGIAIMIDAITFGMAGAVNFVNALMGTLPGATEAYTPSTTVHTKEKAILGLQEGGIALSHGIYELAEGGKPEIVMPLDKWEKSVSQQTALLGLMHDELVVLNYYNRKMVAQKEWELAFE